MSDFALQLHSIKTEIEQLRSTLAEGTAADITSLGPQLEAMNSVLLTLPKEEGRTYIDTLLEIDQSLAELKQDFVRQRENAQTMLNEMGARLKASTAYAKSAAAIKKDDESA